jgi:hypothetical protein
MKLWTDWPTAAEVSVGDVVLVPEGLHLITFVVRPLSVSSHPRCGKSLPGHYGAARVPLVKPLTM